MAQKYSFSGASNGLNPPIILVRGTTYTFNVTSTGHPLWIKTSRTAGTGNAYSTGVTNNGASSGAITFTVPQAAPNLLYYVSENDVKLSNEIYVVNSTISIIGDTYSQGNNILSGSLTITGSLNISGSITGSQGVINQLTASYAITASYILNAVSASYASASQNAQTASYVLTAQTASYAVTASYVIGQSTTSSFALTASYVNPLRQNIQLTGSLFITSSTTALSLIGSGSNVFSVDGTSGRLFSVDDSLSGSLFSVNTAAGLPIIEAFSDNTVRIGQFGQKGLFVSGSKVGIGKEIPLNAALDISGSIITTGSISATLGFTGSLFGTASYATTASYAITASYLIGLNISQIATGSVTASVSVNATDLFLIKSGSNSLFSINQDTSTTLQSNLFIIKNFTTQQPVLTVSQSIVQFATQSTVPTGTTTAGSIWFTSSSMYIGLE